MSVLFTSATKLGPFGHQSHASNENNLKLFWFSRKKKKIRKITFDTKLSYEVSIQNQFLFIAGRSYNKSKSVCQFKAKHPLVRYWSCVRGKC